MKTLSIVLLCLFGTIFSVSSADVNNFSSRKIRALLGALQSEIKSCKEATESGVYQLKEPALTVVCETETLDGGWLVIQQRKKLDLNFTRGWTDYRNGFGVVENDESFWLGNEAIHRITNGGEYELLVEWKRKIIPEHIFVRYSQFHVAGESDKYRLTIGGFQNGASQRPVEDKFGRHNNMQFTTYDSDNDIWDDGNCGNLLESGWWFYNCASCNLNYPKGPFWAEMNGYKTYSRMMIRQK